MDGVDALIERVEEAVPHIHECTVTAELHISRAFREARRFFRVGVDDGKQCARKWETV